jgi:small subunit ribosomal protein S6
LIGEIERRLRVSEPVIKFITVRMDEEVKRLAKVKALRDLKVKRSAQPTVTQHAPASISAAADAPEPNADAEAPVAADPEVSAGDTEPIATAV